MATAIDRHNPSFSLFPIQNARTAYQPVHLPVILVTPFRRTPEGDDIAGSNVFDVKFFIENAPGRARVAGFKNTGIVVPRLERFVVNISESQLLPYKVDLVGQVFIDQNTGAEKNFEDAIDGDEFYLTIENGDVRDRLIFYADADYFDLSPITIETIQLKPLGQYNFVWQASYKSRSTSPDDEAICIVDSDKLTKLSVAFNHPGDVHRAMVQNTPNIYFDKDKTLDQDEMVAFYRPFADVLQDIFDEHTFIESINWANDIPAQYIPYLSFIIGWDPPYLPALTTM